MKMLQDLAERTKNQGKKDKALELQQQLQKQIQETVQGMDPDGIKEITQGIGKAMGAAAGKAGEETQKNKANLSAWGLEDTINLDRIPLEDKKYAIERIRQSNKIKKFTDSIGKMRTLAKSAFKKKQRNVKVEIEGIQFGNNLSNILPQEMMKLKNETLKLLFYKDFLENNLLEYEKTYSEETGKGPIVCCLDESGSMMDEREVWSKAVVVGLLELAQLQKRDFSLCSFTTGVIREYEFPKGAVNAKDLFDIVELFANGGGTDFIPPLRSMLDPELSLCKHKFRN